eukprot:658472_1
MCTGCLPVTSSIAIICVVVGFVLPSAILLKSILFWIGIGVLIIVLAASFTKYSGIEPTYGPNLVSSSDPEISLECTNKFESKFVRLSHGKTYVSRRIFDSKDDEKYDDDATKYDMVLVHGFGQTTEWDAVVKSICNKQDIGEHNKVSSILVYHLYGRGYSDAPLVPNSLPLFTQQLSELLMVLNMVKPIILVGFSMGGAVSMGFAATFPSKIHKLILLGPAGLPVHKPFTAKLATLPVLGELLMPLLAKSEMINSTRSEFHDLNSEDARKEMARYENEVERWFRFHWKGANYSLLSTLRYFPLGEMQRDYFEKLYVSDEFDNQRWMFVWAVNDTTAPFQNSQIFKDIKLVKVENANHMDVVAPYGVAKWFGSFWIWL